mgnify:CR=1 FL=1
MKLWLLRPVEGLPDNPWEPWYDKVFGSVVRAATEQDARNMAREESGVENPDLWKDHHYTTCMELLPDGEPGVLIVDERLA